MSQPTRYYAMIMGKPSGVIAEPPTVAIFLMPTTVDPPKMPPGARLLNRVEGSYGQAVDNAIDYLRALRQVVDTNQVDLLSDKIMGR